MHRSRTLRTLALALACTAALALAAPVAASPPPTGPAALWQWFVALVGFDSAEGEAGAIADPDGLQAAGLDEAGGIHDHNGITAPAPLNEEGSIHDPNG